MFWIVNNIWQWPNQQSSTLLMQNVAFHLYRLNSSIYTRKLKEYKVKNLLPTTEEKAWIIWSDMLTAVSIANNW